MNRLTHAAPISRRNLLKAGGGALAAATVVPHLGAGTATAQTPKRGGTVSLRLWDPPHFDPHLTISYKINVLYTFTHSRLLKHKAGPGVMPGTFPIEGDLAESWTQPTETTYIFKLRKGVRWHNKPPVNGRELTADDVKYTFDRFVTEKGNANRAMMAALDKVEVVDKYTVKFTLKEPYVWFLDMVSNPMALAIIPKEAVEKFGDLKKPESVIGTGPWMLDSYRPNVGPRSSGTRTTSCPGCRTSTRSRSPSTRTTPRGWPPSSPASTTSAMRRPARSPASTGCSSRTR